MINGAYLAQKSHTMNIKLNGENKNIAENTTVLMLLEDHHLKPHHVVVELNKEILDKNDFSTKTISEGDSLEVIQFVPGG